MSAALIRAPRVAFASEAEEAQARERYAIIEPLIDFEIEQHTASQQQMHLPLNLYLADGREVRNATLICEYLSEQHGVSARTLLRWVQRYKLGGLPALADGERSDKGKSRFFEQHPKAAALAAYVYLEQRQSVRTAYEAILRDCLSLGLKPSELPSYQTVRSFLKAISPAMAVLAREGRAAYRERMAPYISRGYDDVAANEIWVSDHMIHDVEVQNDCFLDAPMGTPIRLRFTCLLDFHSRFAVGASWAWEGSSRSIGTALRHAVTQYGPAEMLYCDNGKDYLKVAKGALPAYLRESPDAAAEWYEQELHQLEELGVLARLGIAVQHCIVRHPQSKHVERFFRTVHERFDKKFPTYTGGSPGRRPDFTTEAMAEHRKLLRMGLPGMSLHPLASQFIGMCLAWLDEYNQRPHSGRGMDGLSPRDVFARDFNPRQRPAPEPETLALLLMERERRSVRECAVALNKRRYLGQDEIARAILHEMNEREVLVAYDPLDLGSAAVLDLSGRLITWVKAEHYLPQAPSAGEAVAESMAERRRLEKATRESILAIGDQARENGAATEVEHLARKVRILPMAVGAVMTQRRERRCPDDTASAPASALDIAKRFWED